MAGNPRERGASGSRFPRGERGNQARDVDDAASESVLPRESHPAVAARYNSSMMFECIGQADGPEVATAMGDSSKERPTDPDPGIAAADWLFKDDPAARSPARPAKSASSTESGDTFALADGPSTVEEPPRHRSRPFRATSPAARPAPNANARPSVPPTNRCSILQRSSKKSGRARPNGAPISSSSAHGWPSYSRSCTSPSRRAG